MTGSLLLKFCWGRIRIWDPYLFAILVLVPALARADEPLFGFTYTTDLLPKGKFEVEQWSTTRFTKATGHFWQQENRTEFEYGVNDRFQFSLYGNYFSTAAYHNGPFGATMPGEPFSYDVPGPDDHYGRTRFIGVSGEAIYRLLSPYTHPVGVALYFEPTIGPGFVEPESRLILQKNFRDDRLVLGFNFTYAPEYRRLPPTGLVCAWLRPTSTRISASRTAFGGIGPQALNS